MAKAAKTIMLKMDFKWVLVLTMNVLCTPGILSLASTAAEVQDSTLAHSALAAVSGAPPLTSSGASATTAALAPVMHEQATAAAVSTAMATTTPYPEGATSFSLEPAEQEEPSTLAAAGLTLGSASNAQINSFNAGLAATLITNGNSPDNEAPVAQTIAQESLTAETDSQLTDSPATVASSNAPATTTLQQETTKAARQQQPQSLKQQNEFMRQQSERPALAATAATLPEKRQALLEEGEGAQGEQQQQLTLTTDVPRHIHKQRSGNADISATESQDIGATMLPLQDESQEPGPKTMQDIAPTTMQGNVVHSARSETEIVLDSLRAPVIDRQLQDTKAKMSDEFAPLTQDANKRLLLQRTIDQQNWKQNLLPNEVESYDQRKENAYEHNINWSPYLRPATPAVDFTGKVLQERDGVITEIEESFRLKEFSTDTAEKVSTPTTESPKPAASALEKPALKLAVNHEIMLGDKWSSQHPATIAVARPIQFIERRVKKSFDFPMHRMASDAMHGAQHFDFANTKFSSNINEPMQHLSSGPAVNQGHDLDALHVPRLQPEFSTTKFYNSKELYNEMLQHKAKQQQVPAEQHQDEVATPSLALNSFAVLHSPKIAKLEELHELREPQKTLAIKRVTVQATKHPENAMADVTEPAPKTSAVTSSAATTTTSAPATTTISSSTSSSSSTASAPVKKFQKEVKKAKLLLKTMTPARQIVADKLAALTTAAAVSTSTDAATPAISANGLGHLTPSAAAPFAVNPHTGKPLDAHRPASSANNLQALGSPASSLADTSSASVSEQGTQVAGSTASTPPLATYWPTAAVPANPTKSPPKPILRPRILSSLQEKINSLECEIQNVPQDSHLWRGNETHELLLPIMTPENCKTDKDCTAMMVSWEGEAEIQSGDILIVEVNDALLNPKDVNLTTSAHNTQVYQVTRSGHEHCDVTEGILLDITPLIVDGRKLVTLYDKDLTEGVNLLIVVSELWGSQCVRLKVTTKTENCGENSDCSGKGVCFSNVDMEEYECQCCSGFAGPHCEEIDACTPSPCTNNGICVDLSQGHEGNSYQCLCPYGYTGKNCQYELDPCNPAECLNGGSCVGNSTHFRCECMPGFTGPLCQHSLNECESSPCIHGICVDQEDGFRCFCQPGFAGELCNFEYNECESNPCQNGGECIDHIGSFECHCTKGYTGNRCHIKVDFCANNPCPEGRRCIDHGNDFSCECLGGRNGPDCNEMLRTQCNVNPCTHGGTCWSSGDSFYCACRPGYTGTMCEDEFVVETVVSSSEFMVDDTSARNFNDKGFGSSVVLKSPIELHNAYTAAIVLALVIFFVALYLTICHCKVNQTYRKFSTRNYGFLPIIGFRWRSKQASKISRHWLSGKGLGVGSAIRGGGGGGGGGGPAAGGSAGGNSLAPSQRNNVGHLPTANSSTATSAAHQRQHHVGQLNERPFQRHLAMNLENDMYYTVDFGENSQHSPLIQ